jgi:transcriptional regulator with XRE-family HTH domain
MKRRRPPAQRAEETSSNGSKSSKALDELARSQIKRWILLHGISQERVAAHVGKTQAWLSRYLAGDYSADLGTLQLLAELFGHGIGEVLAYEMKQDERTLLMCYRACRAAGRKALLDVADELSRPPDRESRKSPR